MGELTVIILSILMVVMCWIMIKVNAKVDYYIQRFKKLERALLKNATGQIPVPQDNQTPGAKGMDIPSAATSRDLPTGERQYIAKK